MQRLPSAVLDSVQGLRPQATPRSALRRLVAVFVGLLFCGAALAGSYDAGFASYQKGDLSGAETALRQALGGKLPHGELAKIHKLLGICQFMRGDKSAAGASFKRALALQPGLAIATTEVLDEGVIVFFNSQKSATSTKPSAAARSAARRPASKVEGGALGTPPPQTLASSKLVKSTFLKVASNVPSAAISIDGILAGQANSLINTDPGSIVVEVSAPGYLTKKLKLNVVKNRENTVTVKLEKQRPKPRPKQKGGGSVDGQGPLVASKGEVKKRKTKKRGRGELFAPVPNDEMLQVERSGGEPAPAAPGGDPVAEFEMDAATGGAYAGAPQGAAHTSQAAAPGSVPPMYQVTVYYTSTPPLPPPSTLPPPADPGYGNPETSGDVLPEQLPPDPAGPPPSEKSRKSDKSMLVAVLPFGIGQFQNKSQLLGAAFGVAEVGALLYAYKNDQDAKRIRADMHAYVEQARAARGGQLSNDDRAIIAGHQAFIERANRRAQLSLLGFGVLWAASAIEAVLHEPPPKKKRRKPVGFANVPGDDGTSAYELLDEADERRYEAVFKWGLAVEPGSLNAFTPDSSRVDPGVGLRLAWEF